MNFSFNSKQGDESVDEEPKTEKSKVPAEDVSIEAIGHDDAEALARYDQVVIDADSVDGMGRLDALIPAASAAVDAMEQWDQAIVRFPKNTGWNDLLNRKTPGWEDWKQLGSLKNGEFQPQAAIKQAKLQPAAIGNLALQGAAIVVGQAYMTEINNQLDDIRYGISAIQQEMSLDREAKIEARFEKLQEYAACYEENCARPEKRQAVLNNVEAICLDALEAWKFEVKSMHNLEAQLSKTGRLKDDELRNKIREFQSRERDSQTAFTLYACAEQVSMQYDGDFSQARIERERNKAAECLKQYEEARGGVRRLLSEKIERAWGDLIAVPDLKDEEYEQKNFVDGALHTATSVANKITPLALIGEGKRKTTERKANYQRAVDVSNPVAEVCAKRDEELDRIDFLYNKADTMLIADDGIHLIDTGADGEPSEQ